MNTLIDKPRPGSFAATCKQSRWVTAEFAVGFDLDRLPAKWDKTRECSLYEVPCNLSTTDRAEFEHHMRDGHRRRKSTGHHTSWSQGIKRGWKGPALTVEGQPFQASSKAIAEVLHSCAYCGLVAEVGGTAAAVLWWDAHLRACALTDVA
jgi:hypothetical protein